MSVCRKLIFVLILLILLPCLFIPFPEQTLKIAICSPADAYGNDINYVEVWEDETLKANLTLTNGSVSVNGSKTITFIVSIKFNSTLASSTTEAIDYTRVLVNITGIWINKELNNTECILSNGFYWLKEVGIVTGLAEGESYEVDFFYKTYY